MSKTLSAKYYQEYKERLRKKDCKRYQNLSKEEKEKNGNMVVNVTKISQKIKNKSLLSVEKNIIEWKKRLIIKSNDLESSFDAINLLQKAYLNKKRC